VNFDDVAINIVKVVHVATSFRHEHALNQLASGATVTLADAWRRTE
jgi:hypothetical protein